MWGRWSTGERQWGRRRDGATGKSGSRWDRSVFGCCFDSTSGVAGREGLIISPADWLAHEGRKPIFGERISAGMTIVIDNRRISTSIIAVRGMPGEGGIRLCTWKRGSGEISVFFNRRYDRRLLVGTLLLLGVVLMCPGYGKMGYRPQSLERFNIDAAG